MVRGEFLQTHETFNKLSGSGISISFDKIPMFQSLTLLTLEQRKTSLWPVLAKLSKGGSDDHFLSVQSLEEISQRCVIQSFRRIENISQQKRR